MRHRNVVTRGRNALPVALLTVGALMAGCSSSSSPQASGPQKQTSTAGKAGAGTPPAKISTTRLDPKNFDDPATGRSSYDPLVPGTQSVREGSTRVGGRAVPHQVTTTVTDLYRTIGGVRTVISFDHEVDGGQVAQESIDYLAEDKAGNVWNLGGYTQQYEGGRFVAAQDAFLHGVNGATAGVLVQAHPSVTNPVYSVSKPDREEDSVAEVIKVGVRHCVPFDCFKDVLIVREGKRSAPDNEFKYYARDVGQIDNVPRGASVHKDVEKLVNLQKLSRSALTEFDKEALRLDRAAPTRAKRVFGGLPGAKRG